MTDAMPLSTLTAVPGVGEVHGDQTVCVTGVRSDSRAVLPGDLFAAVTGATVDGARFVPDAIARGAVAVLTERQDALSVPRVHAGSVRETLGWVAHRVYGNPSVGWPVVGVTGTNGKTTVTYLLESMLTEIWGPVALSGTIAMRGPASSAVAALTTPEADDLARFAREQRDAGARALLLEASSIALAQGRLNGLCFEVAAYTNLSQDHLDFHGDMERYGATKARLFLTPGARHSVVCVDDAFGANLAKRAAGTLWRCSTEPLPGAEISVQDWRSGREGLTAKLRTPLGEVSIESPLIGRHNLQNLCVSLGVACALGIPAEQAAAALGRASGAPGRMERVEDPHGVAIFVDYAHTPDAVTRALEALRGLTQRRLFIVVGCGGDRDAAKRGPMGRAAALGADVAVLTSDNPRTEVPDAILAQLRDGALESGAVPLSLAELSTAQAGFACEVDRARAIAAAVCAAQPGDTLLIAGKGHEDYQIIGTKKWPFDDREVARAAVAARGEG